MKEFFFLNIDSSTFIIYFPIFLYFVGFCQNTCGFKSERSHSRSRSCGRSRNSRRIAAAVRGTVNPLRKKMVKKWSKFWSKNPPSSCGLHPSSCVKIFFFLTQQRTYLNFLCFHFLIVFIFCPKKKLKLLR